MAYSTAFRASSARLLSVLPPWAMSGLPPPRPPEGLSGDAYQLASVETAVTGARCRHDDNARLVDDPPTTAATEAESWTRLRISRARSSQVVAGHAVRAVGDIADTPHVMALGDDADVGQHSLALRSAIRFSAFFELGNELVDPVGELLRLHFERVAEFQHQRPFLGEIAERLDADERLNPSNARSDARLAGDRDQSDLGGC